MGAYSSGEAWGRALEALFNPEAVVGDAGDAADAAAGDAADAAAAAAAADARIRAAVSVLYVPGQSRFVLDGRSLDYEAIVRSVYDLRRTNASAGTCVRISTSGFARDDAAVPPTVRCVWHIAACADPAAGPPAAERPLPPVIEVRAHGTLDGAGPDARCITITAQSRALEASDESGSD